MMRVYVGFTDGKPFRETYEPYGCKTMPVFTSRRAARRCFQDVRAFVLISTRLPATAKPSTGKGTG
jgi:hypothetical protein